MNLGGDIPCKYCGSKTNPVWFTDNVFWNAVVGEIYSPILCVYCFIKEAEVKFDVKAWRIIPEFKWEESK